MLQPQAAATDVPRSESEISEAAWRVVLAASSAAENAARAGTAATFALSDAGDLRTVAPGDPAAVLRWCPESGWQLLLPVEDPRNTLIDLYLPICSATAARPITVGHLGQSLDGFIATHSGDSQFVTGSENIVHLHRLRALCDAIVVGAGTVAVDDPQLTTRHVAGPSPLRVVLDPMRRLGEHYKVFRDHAAETLYICGHSVVGPTETHVGRARLLAVADTPNGMDVAAVLRLLHARGCHRVFVEGGGVTVSMFLEANLLDRLQIAIAPLIIGSGRPAIRIPPRTALRDCDRPPYRVYRMGGDIFFDCELKPESTPAPAPAAGEPSITRII
jgi:riboflavin-specific deaminase-like protein